MLDLANRSVDEAAGNAFDSGEKAQMDFLGLCQVGRM
jgi:hypothetical protein